MSVTAAGGAASERDSMRRSQLAENIANGQTQITRQQAQIRHVAGENEELKRAIATVTGDGYDYVKVDKLASLQSDVDALERRYQFEKMRRNDLTKRYQLARVDLLHSRKVKGGVNVEREQAETVRRQVETLENRLDQALGKFNDALSYNKELRDQIEIVREERRVFQRVHARLTNELRSRKQLMAQSMERCNADVDARDELHRAVMKVHEALAAQQRDYQEKMAEINANMTEIKTMREEQANLQLELEAREYEFESEVADATTAGGGGAAGGAPEPSANTSVANTTNTSALPSNRAVTSKSGDSSVSDDNRNDDGDVLHVEGETLALRTILDRLRDLDPEVDLDNLRETFVQLGDRNFAMYKYINELTVNKEALTSDTHDIHALLREEDASEHRQRELIERLEEQLATTESQLESMHRAIQQKREVLQAVCEAVEEVYEDIGCATAAGTPTPSGPCGEANVMSFLGAIEARTTQIMAAARCHARLEMLRREQVGSQGPPSSQRPDAKTAASPAEDDSKSALTTNASSARGELPPVLAPENLDDHQLQAFTPTAPALGHSAVSAQQLVRQMELPSASLGGGPSGVLDTLEDHVVSHQVVRERMKERLLVKREREERGQRKRKEMLTVSQPSEDVLRA